MDSQETIISTQTQEISDLMRKDPFMQHRIDYFLSRQDYQESFNEILNEVNEDMSRDYAVYVNLTELRLENPELYKRLCSSPHSEYTKWNSAAGIVQQILIRSRTYFLEEHATVKELCTVRFYNKPETEETFPSYKANKKFIQIRGTVQSISEYSYVEHAVEFVCKKCSEVILCPTEYNKHYHANPPPCCPHGSCKGLLEVKEDTPSKSHMHPYQEIFLEQYENKKTRHITVTAEDDLVNVCSLGEEVTVVGTVEIRQINVYPGQECENTVVVKANSIKQKGNRVESLSEDQRFEVEDAWFSIVNERGEFDARDFLIESFLPQVYGMNLAKFAVMLSVASCVEREDKRPHSHTLLVGEPGIAKSELLIRASELSPKSFFGGGYRVSKAGLTAGVRKQEKEEVYEAGILPICDGGVCCIDEFNQMSEDDKCALHEAMEQQTISLAKCGVVTKLRSRCVIIAACNPKNLIKFMSNINTDNLEIEFGLQPALMSRFDVILVLQDPDDTDYDRQLVRHISKWDTGEIDKSQYWSLEKLKRHFLAVRDVKPKMTVGAEQILKAYYFKLCNGACSDNNRITFRCYESLTRLSLAYCRLLMKTKVTELDTICIIRIIMENSYAMGKILKRESPVKKSFPFGPTERDIKELLHALELSHLISLVMQQLAIAEGRNRNVEGLASGITAVPVNNAKKSTVWDQFIQASKSNLARSERPTVPPVPVEESSSNLFSCGSSDISFRIRSSTNTSTQINNQPSRISQLPGPSIETDDYNLEELCEDWITENPYRKGAVTELIDDGLNTLEASHTSEKNQTITKMNEENYLNDELDELAKDLLGDRYMRASDDSSPTYSLLIQNTPPTPIPAKKKPVTPVSPKQHLTIAERTAKKLKQLHHQFAFSQVLKRRQNPTDSGMDTCSFDTNLEVQPPKRKTSKRKQPQALAPKLPTDNLTDLDIDNMLDGIKEAFGMPSKSQTIDKTTQENMKMRTENNDKTPSTQNSGSFVHTPNLVFKNTSSASKIVSHNAGSQKLDISILGGLIDESFFDEDDDD